MKVEPRTIVVYSDIGCPWAHLAVYRLHLSRVRLDLQDEVLLDHRCFPLEIFNEQPTPKLTLDAEVPVAGALDPGAGWGMWTAPAHEYPVTTLPALEAVQAAKGQGPAASEALDRALRLALFRDSRNISMRHEILAVAKECEGVDAAVLQTDLDAGRARSTVLEQARLADGDEVRGSPHIFLPDGSDVHNPGIDMVWEGPKEGGFPIVKADDPKVYEEILERAARA